MNSIRVITASRTYDIVIGSGQLGTLGRRVLEVTSAQRAHLVVDASVAETHGARARQSLAASGLDCSTTILEASESRKSMAAVEQIHRNLLERRMERREPVVAVGGGIIGDIAGFAAATWLRGVPVIQCPTTLLAMVDASVGGKTGVNLALPNGSLGKNLVGAFWQPHLIVIDPHVLETLPHREFRAGLAECIKHALIAESAAFDWLEQHLDQILALQDAALIQLIRSHVAIKAAIVGRDEREETGERALLNLGHTFGHAFESLVELKLLHGEAVGIGLVAASHVASRLNAMTMTEAGRVGSIVQRAGLPTRLPQPVEAESLIQAMHFDKKVRSGKLQLVLPNGIGRAELRNDVPDNVVLEALRAVGAT